jgi:hypothetical protein
LLPRGAVVPPVPVTVDDFDRAHGQYAKSELFWQVSKRTYGADCPTEVQAWGMTTWWTLGRFVSGLRLGPGQLLLDLACGRGGIGLWLAVHVARVRRLDEVCVAANAPVSMAA